MLTVIACLMAIGVIIRKLTNRQLKRAPMSDKRAQEIAGRRF